jgi:O-antigen ligase
MAEVFSWLAFAIPKASPFVFLIILIGVGAISFFRLELGLYILLAELFIGGLGHLFYLDINGLIISVRMGLFGVILIARFINKIKNHELGVEIKKILQPPNSKFLIPYLALFLLVLNGTFHGFLNNRLSTVLADANAWFFLVLIFVFWSIINSKKITNNIVRILLAGSVWLSFKTILTLFLFSRGLVQIQGLFYQWLRQTGVGEVTYISGSMFRVFFQSQIYCLIGFLLVLIYLTLNFKIKEIKKFFGPLIYLFLTGLAVIVSQSRSFWVGTAAAIFIFIILAWWRYDFRLKKTFWLILFLAIMVTGQLFFVSLISGDLIGNRFSNLEKEPASASRLNQLTPLIRAIAQKPIFGWGFGKELAYQSQDPRILKSNPDGWHMTYAFEWGYLDIALKLGLVGLTVYSVLIGWLFWQGIKKIRNQKSEIKAVMTLQAASCKLQANLLSGLLLGLLALCITNIFTPYLNHPLGLGYILLITVIINQHD